MKDRISFSEEELDILKEVSNIGMGMAGCSLAEALGCFVTLNVPEIRLIESSKLKELSNQLTEKFTEINLVRQAFSGNLNGESIVIIGKTAYLIKDLLGYEESEDLTRSKQMELLSDISNSITSACLQEIAKQLSLELSLAPPKVLCFEQPANMFYSMLFGNTEPKWEQALFIKVQFHLQDRDFWSELFVFFSQSSLVGIKKAVHRLMEASW
jgi:chemotaxis protein CheC